VTVELCSSVIGDTGGAVAGVVIDDEDLKPV